MANVYWLPLEQIESWFGDSYVAVVLDAVIEIDDLFVEEEDNDYEEQWQETETLEHRLRQDERHPATSAILAGSDLLSKWFPNEQTADFRCYLIPSFLSHLALAAELWAGKTKKICIDGDTRLVWWNNFTIDSDKYMKNDW